MGRWRNVSSGILATTGIVFLGGCGSGPRAELGYGPVPELVASVKESRDDSAAGPGAAGPGADSADESPVEFYFYLNSDNDILGTRPDGSIDNQAEILYDELRALAPAAGFGVHAYLDRGPLSGRGGDPIDSETYDRCAGNEAKSAALGETSSADPKHLTALLAKRCFPAAKRFVVLWSHGDGFRAQSDFDYSPSGKFHIARLLAAIPDGFAEAVLFDSCAMADLEIAFLLEKKAKWMVASQFELPNAGIQYGNLPKYLAKGRETRPLLAALRAESERKFAEIGMRAPLALVDLAKLAPLRAAFAAAYAAAAESAGKDYAAFRESIVRQKDGDLFFLFTRFAPESLKTLADALDAGRGSLHFALPRTTGRDDDLDAVAEAAPEVFRTWSENFPNWAAYARLRSSPADVSNVSYPSLKGVRL